MRGRRRFLLLVLLSWLMARGTVDAQEESREYEIKAAFLKNFLGFVEWPDDGLSKDSRSITIGIVGRDHFGKHLEALKDKEAKQRTIKVANFESLADVKDCQLLFVSKSLGEDAAAALRTLKGRPILIVGEVSGFVERGGMIGFVMKDNKIKFEVNMGTTKAAGLKVSSRLLDVALRVEKDAPKDIP